MMSGYVDHLTRSAPSKPRRYTVVPRAGGWSISLNGVCTRPFRSRWGAERIAATLQRQADALAGKTRPKGHGTPGL
jgi:hypothetical protein